MTKAIGILLLFACASLSAQRLPDSAVPERYQITLARDLATAKFAGEETISVRIPQPTDVLTLNAAEIRFEQVTVSQSGTGQPAKVALQPDREMATLRLVRTLAAGPATIHIRYEGKLNDQMRGFYLSKTSKRNYALTQFENTDARRAFPSFDEPAL